MTTQQKARNPVWSRDELILALNLYFQFRISPPSPTSSAVKELSILLNRMAKAVGQSPTGTYRNGNGISMKLMNFRRFDPEFMASGRVGLRRGNRDEKQVWDEFSNDLARLAYVAKAIEIATVEFADTDDLYSIPADEICEAEEGRILTRLHLFRERNKGLAKQCKLQAVEMYGALRCSACGFIAEEKYGSRGSSCIEVHHTQPVHTLTDGAKTKLKDLVLLCANCHRIVHGSKQWLSIEQLKAFLN